MTRALHDELFVYSSCIESSCCRDPERVVGLIFVMPHSLHNHPQPLSTCSFLWELHNTSNWILKRLQGWRIWRANSKASIFLEQMNKTPVRVFGVQVMINDFRFHLPALQATRTILRNIFRVRPPTLHLNLAWILPKIAVFILTSQCKV